jgi:putative hemolysin
MLAEETIAPDAVWSPACPERLPPVEVREGRYLLRFARTAAELDAILKLRFEVFNLELGEGLAASFPTGRDQDEFDLTCHHLMVIDTVRRQVVGTYRIQTGELAAAAQGFYAAGEFDLAHLPLKVQREAVELGRACIAREHRHTQVLFLLWKGLAAYLTHNRKRYLFGCCSLTSQDARLGLSVLELLRQGGHLHPSLQVPPRPECACRAEESPAGEPPKASLPKLFRTYLRIGAKVCGPPAIDRQFQTIDYLVLFDVNELDEPTRRMFFGAGEVGETDTATARERCSSGPHA